MSYDHEAERKEWKSTFVRCTACENGDECDNCECYDCWLDSDYRVGED